MNSLVLSMLEMTRVTIKTTAQYCDKKLMYEEELMIMAAVSEYMKGWMNERNS